MLRFNSLLLCLKDLSLVIHDGSNALQCSLLYCSFMPAFLFQYFSPSEAAKQEGTPVNKSSLYIVLPD